MKNFLKKIGVPIILTALIICDLLSSAVFATVRANDYAQTIDADFSAGGSVSEINLGNGARVLDGKLVMESGAKIDFEGKITYFIFTMTGIEASGEIRISFGGGSFVSVDSAQKKIKSNVSGSETEIDIFDELNLNGAYKLRVKVTNGSYEGRVESDEWVVEKTPSVVEIGIAGADAPAIDADKVIARFDCTAIEEGYIGLENLSSSQIKTEKIQIAPIGSNYEIERRDYRDGDDDKEYPVKPDVNAKTDLKTILLIAIPATAVVIAMVVAVVLVAKKRRKC